MESVAEIAETDWSRLGRTQDNRVTLITCISGKPSLRLCVQAVEKHNKKLIERYYGKEEL